MAAKKYETKRILIWGKTYPELSTIHFETVCAAGVTEDGSPIRLYPIPYRYLSDEDKFRRYQWITARVARNHSDPRPESYAIDCESIELGDFVDTDDYEWDARAAIVFQDQSWQFETVDQLLDAQKNKKTSIGVVTPRQILKIEVFERPQEEKASFQDKLARVRKKVAADILQLRLFDDFFVPELRNLEFMNKRIRIDWLC
jgi:hypothetical protein